MSDTINDVRIEVRGERCIASGNCTRTAPKYFDQNAVDGTVTVRRNPVDNGDQKIVQTAASLCPVSAILLKRRR